MLVLLLVLIGNVSFAQSATEVENPRPVEKARRTYMGRIVAQPMSHLGADWLIRPERNDEERATEAMAALNITPGLTVVDLGCGNGFWTIPLAKKCRIEQKQSDTPENPVASSDDVKTVGKVLAVDIQREMLIKLRENLDRAGVDNVIPVLGEVDDPKLPLGVVEMVLMVDVYHEFSHPESMLWSIRRSLAPTGVIALLEYRAEDASVPIKPLHKMSKDQIMKEYSASKLKLVREVNSLPWQHLMFFARDDSPLPAIEPEKWRR